MGLREWIAVVGVLGGGGEVTLSWLAELRGWEGRTMGYPLLVLVGGGVEERGGVL